MFSSARSLVWLWLGLWLGLLAVTASASPVDEAPPEEEDDDIRGPIMPTKEGGALYNSTELAARRGYASESAQVTTADGYLLTVFRVRPKVADPKAHPVLIYHGLLLSSDVWLTDADALPFALSDAGYDVWLANMRGNAYSRRHLTLRPDADPTFWKYCWHEIGTGDLPAVIEHVTKATGRASVHYVGHSLGVAVGLVMCSILPSYNARLRSFAAMAPAVYLSKLVDMAGPDGMVHDMADKFFNDLKAAGKHEVFQRSDVKTDGKNQITCADLADFREMCEEKLEEGRVVLGGGYLPAGTSWRTIECFKQAIDGGGVIGRFNYSTKEANVKAYGSDTPPPYAFGNVTVPVTLYSTVFDQLIQPDDVDDLKAQLKNVVGDVRIAEPECFEHVTFVTARQKSCLPARRKLYQGLVAAIKQVDNA